MQHPVLDRFFHFLDRMIQEHGDQLFVVFAYICFGVIMWILARRRKQPPHGISVIILPPEERPKRNSDPDPPPPTNARP
jgi:hypothetical protein